MAASADDVDDRKLFVGSLSWETKEPNLKEYFGKFGEVESANLKTDQNTGRSRGFAFIVFKECESVDKVIEAGNHVINGRKVDTKKAKAKQGKIFVGGLKPELSDEDIKTHFEQFGTIVETGMPKDKATNTRKGFCFITYEKEAVVTELLKNPKQTINGVEVDVKKATPKTEGGPMGRGGGGWGPPPYGYPPYGGPGYGYGGYGGYDAYGYPGYGGYAGYDYGNYGSYGGGRGGGKRHKQ